MAHEIWFEIKIEETCESNIQLDFIHDGLILFNLDETKLLQFNIMKYKKATKRCLCKYYLTPKNKTLIKSLIWFTKLK
jgi:hypothetical protein